MVEYEKYKGNNIIVLKNSQEDRFPFSFGYKKARLIVDNYEQIKKWVSSEEKRNESSGGKQ